MPVPDATAGGASPPESLKKKPGDGGYHPREIPAEIGKYQVIGYVKSGGFGDVYKAKDPQTGETVAIKVLRSDISPTAEEIQKFKAEAAILGQFDRPGIVRVIAFSESPCYIVTQYMPGGSLGDRLPRASDNRERWWTVRQAVELVEQLARILSYAHGKGIVHRDIKPDNILLDERGQPYLADFGLVLLDAARARAAGLGTRSVGGTPGYLSPEQARGGSETVDARSDIFSLGVVLYELLVQRKPFKGSRNEQIAQTADKDQEVPPLRTENNEAIPAELEQVCLKALHKDIHQRYTTALDFARALAAILTTLPPDTPPRSQPVKHKGLVSYDHNDPGFLRLLPDWGENEPFPASVRFWKAWIEDRAANSPTSRVGLMHGPSGCGKSSLVKAGVLPHLNGIHAVYVEATDHGTERELLEKVKTKCAIQDPDAKLPELLAQIAAGRVLDPAAKLLIVLDQFEQWLLAHSLEEDRELLQALQCSDGSRLQCLLLVREEYWSAISRLADVLNVRFVPGENDAFVDLFKPEHAKNVFALFGRALGRLPHEPEPLSKEQKRFVDQVIGDMAAEDRKRRIVSVRLAMYAQLVEDQPWTPQTAKHYPPKNEVFQILRKMFRKGHENKRYYRHKPAVMIVLSSLLGEDVKGAACPEETLRQAAGYAQRPADWKDLIAILNTELRLITSTEPSEDGSHDQAAPSSSDDGGRKLFQLTHDHVVRQTREWVRYEKAKTWRGSAEMKLEERADLWSKTRETRQIPSFVEWIKIRSLTKRRHWTSPQRDMMRVAGRRHIRRLSSTLLILLLIALGLYTWQARMSVGKLLVAEFADVPKEIASLDFYRPVANLLLAAQLPPSNQPDGSQFYQRLVGGLRRWHAPADNDEARQLKVKLALLPSLGTTDGGSRLADDLMETMLNADTPYSHLKILLDALTPYRETFLTRLWRQFRDASKLPNRRFRVGLALAAWHPDRKAWEDADLRLLAQHLLSENPDYQGTLRGYLQPIAGFSRDADPFRPVPAPTANAPEPQLPDSSPR